MFTKFEIAATRAARSILFPLAGGSAEKAEVAEKAIPNIQISIKTGLNMLQFRNLTVLLSPSFCTGFNDKLGEYPN